VDGRKIESSQTASLGKRLLPFNLSLVGGISVTGRRTIDETSPRFWLTRARCLCFHRARIW
jgi:hypothetical protein